MGLDDTARELYGLRPSEFTKARDDRVARARREGDRDLAARIRSLRRPTLAAWAVNLLVRHQPDEVAGLLQLGEAVRGAHRELEGSRLRELARRQHSVVAALSRRAGELSAEAGNPVSESVLREVESTLRAVLADPRSAERFAAGTLTAALEPPVGFPAAGAPAGLHRLRPRAQQAPSASPAPPEPARGRASVSRMDERRQDRDRRRQEHQEHQERLTEARRQARESERAARASAHEVSARERDLQEVREGRAEAERRVADLRSRLLRAEDELRSLEREEGRARERFEAAGAAAAEDRGRAEHAAARVADLAARAPTGGGRGRR